MAWKLKLIKMDAETRKISLKILGERDICNILMIVSHQEDGMEFINKRLCLKKTNDN